MLLNHDRGHKLAATSEGTLELREDSIGLKASADITDEFVISKAKSGLLRGWSFGFRATDQEIEQRSGKIPRRIIKSMDLFEVSVIDDTHTPCYNGCSLEYRADTVDEYEIRSTGNDTVVGAENATATEDTVTDTPEERGRSLELMRLELELMEMEARYNHYHDPHNGRFASAGAAGSGVNYGQGLYYSMGKGKGEIVGANSELEAKILGQVSMKGRMQDVYDRIPQGWKRYNAQTTPLGYTAIYNGVSIFQNTKGAQKGTRQTGLIRENWIKGATAKELKGVQPIQQSFF
jgi:HK97 family phage prohead protease